MYILLPLFVSGNEYMEKDTDDHADAKDEKYQPDLVMDMEVEVSNRV